MIDVNGNEIISPSEEKKDPVFHLNEIRFLMRAFQREATDARALIIAKEISSYLKEDNDRTVIPEILPELEAYGKITENEDFLWELVYIRRQLSKTKSVTRAARLVAANHRCASAELFHDIVRVKPTTFNRCAEVIEYDAAGEAYAPVDKAAAQEIFRRALELYEGIEEVEEELYYTAGQYIYTDLFVYRDKKNADAQADLQLLLKIAYAARGWYRIKPNDGSLKLMGNAYHDCCGYKEFDYEGAKESIDEVIALLEKAISEGNKKMEAVLKGLQAAIKHHCKK